MSSKIDSSVWVVGILHIARMVSAVHPNPWISSCVRCFNFGSILWSVDWSGASGSVARSVWFGSWVSSWMGVGRESIPNRVHLAQTISSAVERVWYSCVDDPGGDWEMECFEVGAGV